MINLFDVIDFFY